VRFESLQNYPQHHETQSLFPAHRDKPRRHHRILSNWTAVARRNFSIRFLEDYLVQQFNDLRNGTREEFLCTFEFRDRSLAERLAAWLREGHTQIKCQWEWETEVLASTEGNYRVAAAKTEAGRCIGLVSHEQ
jgi:hypothetical protein